MEGLPYEAKVDIVIQFERSNEIGISLSNNIEESVSADRVENTQEKSEATFAELGG